MHDLKRLGYFILITLSIYQPVNAYEILKFSGIEGSLNTEISRRVLAEAYRRIGIEIVVEKAPAERSLRLASNGLSDGELFRIDGIEKKYKNLIKIPVAINELEAVVFTHRNDIQVQGWQSLAKYRVGIRRGIKFSEQGTKGMAVLIANRNQDLFGALQRERIDIAIINRVNGLQLLSQQDLSPIHPIQPAIEKYPLYHYLHKKFSHLAPQLTQELEFMEKSGRITEIRHDYITEFFVLNNE